MKRIVTGLALFIAVAAVAAGVGLGHYLLTGGELSELPNHISLSLKNPLPQLRQIFSNGKQSALQTAQQATADAAQQVTQKAVEALPGVAGEVLKSATGFNIPTLGSLPVPPASAPPAPVVKASPDIQVFFAPCEPANRNGVDDVFLAFLQSADTAIYGAFYDLQFREAADVLVAKHKQGVDVRIVTDSDYAAREGIRLCIQAGIPVTFDNRGAFMHNKFCIVDHERVWTGSTNITENCLFKNNNNAVRVNCKQLASDFEVEFGEMHSLRRFGKGSKYATPCPTVTVGNTTIECYFAPEDRAAAEIIEEVDRAAQSIDVMAFSFTSRELAKAMAGRVRQGVAVRALFEKQQAGSKYSQDDYLAGQGARVYLDTNQNNMHNKVIVVDAETVITGSYNFSGNAEKNNDENVLILHDPDIAARYTAEFERLIAN